jgi:hypothetical protein
MTEKYPAAYSKKFWNFFEDLYKKSTQPKKRLLANQPTDLSGLRPPARFITHDPYSTYTIRTYAADSYDLDGDIRAGQEYVVMVDGETPVESSLFKYDPEGNHKQLISFVGDSVSGSVKLILEGQSTAEISLATGTLTEGYLTQKLEALSNIGKGNVKVSVWPGRWLVEFVNQLAGFTFDLFEVDRIDTAVYEVHVHETVWADSGIDDVILFPVPLVGQYDGDDNVVNDAVAAGTIGTAQHFPGIGYVADVGECRDYNGDGTPSL